MLFHQALEVLQQLSESKIGSTPSGNFLRFTQVNQDGDIKDAILTTLESARRTISRDFGSVEFMLYQPNSAEHFIALRGRSAESVAYFDFRALGQRVSELVNEMLDGWQLYDLSHSEVLVPVQGKVLEILVADLAPMEEVALIKPFLFGQPMGEGDRASTVANLILDLIRYTGATESLLPVKSNDPGSVVIIKPEVLQFLRKLADPAPVQPTAKKSLWQRFRGA